MSTLTDAHRAAQGRLAAETVRRFAQWWEVLDPEHLEDTFAIFTQGVASLVRDLRGRAASEAAEYYLASRLQALGDAPRFAPVLAENVEFRTLVARLYSSSVGVVKHKMTTGATLEEAMAAGRSSSAATMAREVLQGGRETVMMSAHQDPQSDGWARVGSGSACGFCQMLIGRGTVYASASAGHFAAHTNCACSAAPVFNATWDGWERADALNDKFAEVTKGLHGKEAVTAFNTHVAAEQRAAAAMAAGG